MIKKIFITGGCGYVGSMLVPELIKNGFDVTVADLLIYGNNINIKFEKLNIINIDIRNLNALEKIIPNHDTVIHLVVFQMIQVLS